MRNKLKNRKGFTIIEVMIVLAIAGLIMLIVFLAVPALQRASRNTNRKNDASRLATSISTFVSNANGDLPCMGTSGSFSTTSTDANTVLNDAGKLGQFTFTGTTSSSGTTASPAVCTNSADPIANTFAITATTPPSAPLSGTAILDNMVEVYLNATCQGTYAVAGNARQAALVYPLETSNGFTWSCISAL